MKSAVYPGTFDPIHNGHMDVIERSSNMFDKVWVVLAVNSKKTQLFTEDERVQMAVDSLSHLSNVEVVTHKGLLVDFAKSKNAVTLIRGLRTVTDFDYEMQIALMNRKMSDIPTIFLMPGEKFTFLNSSIIREISRYGQNISDLVPKPVEEKIIAKFGK